MMQSTFLRKIQKAWIAALRLPRQAVKHVMAVFGGRVGLSREA
jgi:hypothetical protein